MDAQPAQNTNSPQISVLGNIYNNIKKGIDMGKTLIMLQGSARCFAAGTKVRMYDGSLKNIEDIVIGDKVLDMYGNGYNVVTDTHSGYDMMYRITQPRGDDYVVNSRHILSLKQTEHFQSKRIITDENGKKKRIFIPIPYDKDAILDISVEDYIRKSRNFRRKFAGFKNTKVTALPKQNLKIDPYYLGYWIGNGTSKRPTDISTIDTEIIEWFESFAQSLGVTTHRRKCNYSMGLCYAGTHNKRKGGAIREFCDAFRHYNLYNNKHVPSEYIYGDYEDRLKFLAGLIDSDGYDTRRNTLGITQKNTNIAEAIVEICRLSGFYTNGICKKIAKLKRDDGSVYECEVNLIEINHNDFNDLNKYIKVPRKRIHKQCERDYFTTKIHVEKIGVGKFYGFTLDGEPHFLLRDGTIVHNSGKTRNTMIFIVLQCLNEVTKVSIVRQSLPVIKRSVLEDFKIVMRQIGQWDDRRFNKTESIYQFPNGSVLEFFSADDEQKLRGPYRDILYVNEANEISHYAFSMLRQRTYKYTIVDYNPSFTEEHWLFPLMSDERSFHFISTFRDNIFLPKAVVEEIESYQTTNPALWQIFGLGQFAIVDGLVFPKENWDIIPNESYPSWKKEEVIGLDWGFTCFVGETKITTMRGQVSIKDVVVGDMALTRDGWRKVNAVIDNGIRKVHKTTISINDCTIDFTATDNHKFYSNGKWKKYGKLTTEDNLCVLSSSMERFINATQTESTQTTISKNGKRMGRIKANDFIGQYGNTIKELSRMDMIFITKTSTPLTTILAICSWLQIVSMGKFTTLLLNITRRIQKNNEKNKLQRRIGKVVEMFGRIACKLSIKSANGAERILFQRMYTKDFAAKSTTINGNTNHLLTLLRRLVHYAESILCRTNISNNNAAQKNVSIKCCGIQEIIDNGYENARVYDLSIDGCHEYFANGVLVHNCDPSTAVGVIILGDDIYVREIYYEYGLLTKDIADRLEPYSGNYKYCDIDNRLVTELEMNGVTLLYPTKKNSESILSGIRIMNQKHIHITESSTDIIKEFRNYVYKKDRQGNTMYDQNPVGKFDHGVDALRYAVLAEFANAKEDEDIPLSKEALGLFI